MVALALKDASDFAGSTVNQNLVNQVNNMDKYASPADINVSNHANAFNGVATGAEVWYYAGDSIGKAIAEKTSAAIASALGIVNRGAKPTTNLYVISQSLGHTILIEWFFIDNASDVAKWHANKNKAITAVMKVFEGFPQYNFKSTHGGHYGLNLMDPGAVGNGLKEAVVMQEVNKAMLNYKNTGGGGTTVIPPKVDTNKYYDSGSHFKCLKDCPTYLHDDFKAKSEWFFPKNAVFGINDIYVTKTGTTHARIKVNGGTIRVTLNKAWVKKIK